MIEIGDKLIIGVTDTESGYDNYVAWLEDYSDAIEVIRLTPSTLNTISRCGGVVLTGGIDSHPRFYNNSRLDYPNAPSVFNEPRDEFELGVFRYAVDHQIPVLAICRGMQLVNITLGGTLVQDLEEAGQSDHRRCGDTDRLHGIVVETGSLMAELTGTNAGVVNSAHHQALDKVASRLAINAYSEDGVIEGAEWKDKSDKPFLLCVQWHPERLHILTPGNPFSIRVRGAFFTAVLQGSRM